MEYEVIFSARKTIAVQVTSDAKVVVRAPKRMTVKRIETFLLQHREWIEKHLQKAQEMMAKNDISCAQPLSAKEIRTLAEEAKTVLPERTKHFASMIGVSYGRITIRNQKTRWGSCSTAGNLNYNCLLMLTPPQVQDYVAVHELCHRVEMNHSAQFWKLVEQTLPDYRVHRKWLRDHGGMIMARMINGQA